MECFVKEAAWERAICHALSVPTEADKAGQATIEAAQYARLAYVIGIVAIGLSVVSLIVSIIALAK
jgi:hypothetical protein